MKVTTNGISIHIEEQGRGDLALIFLHHWGGSSRTWKYVMASLSKSYRTIAIDHRGWGESDAPAKGYSLADHAEDVLGVIDALRLTKYLIVGHSMSGKIAQLIASRRPAGLIGLVLVASALPGPLEFPSEMLESMVHLYDTREGIEGAIDHAMVAKPLAQVDREQVIADSLRGAPQAKAAWPQSSGLEDIRTTVTLINVPTLAIYGASDNVHSMESIKSELVSRIPGTVLEILPGTGHLPPLESPDELVQLIEKFVAGSLDEYLYTRLSTEEYGYHQPPVRLSKAYNHRALEKSVGYSQAVLVNGQLFISGCVSWDLDGNPLHVGDFESQVKEIYSDIDATLKAHGMDAADIVKETLYTTDMEALIAANPRRKEYYQSVTPPASTWVEVRRLVRPELLLEIEVTALKRR